VAEKTAKAKPQENKPVQNKPVQKVTRTADKDRAKPKKSSAIAIWWRETVGELRKVSWPTYAEARRLTTIVLVVMAVMAVLLGVLDFVFSRLITMLIA
jgi:preprotein translocase subunit SecE